MKVGCRGCTLHGHVSMMDHIPNADIDGQGILLYLWGDRLGVRSCTGGKTGHTKLQQMHAPVISQVKKYRQIDGFSLLTTECRQVARRF